MFFSTEIRKTTGLQFSRILLDILPISAVLWFKQCQFFWFPIPSVSFLGFTGLFQMLQLWLESLSSCSMILKLFGKIQVFLWFYILFYFHSINHWNDSQLVNFCLINLIRFSGWDWVICFYLKVPVNVLFYFLGEILCLIPVSSPSALKLCLKTVSCTSSSIFLCSMFLRVSLVQFKKGS